MVAAQPITAQSTSGDLLSVYLDCRGCDSNFIRSEINFINFVRDQADSEIHLIITRQRTGSGGSQYNLSYIGQKELLSISNELLYNSYDSDTEEEERNGLVRYIKLGLVPYLTQKDILKDFDVNFTGSSTNVELQPNTDKWNNWIFEVGANTWFSGEESRSNLNLNSRLRARRITDNWKVSFGYNHNYRRNVIRTTDDDTGDEVENVFNVESHNMFGTVAYALGDHWSVGSYFNGGSSTRENIDLRFGATPSVEYSFYPYREHARREVTLRYGVFTSFFDYTETTIFGEDAEVLARQELNFSMDYTKPWGEVEARVNGRTYLHDFSKNRLDANFEISMRIFRGFSVFFDTGYSVINDQLSLSAEGLSDEEAIANTRQQATSYEFRGSVGFEITFGSIYDNIVNTRF
jgi:hypothetical protein